MPFVARREERLTDCLTIIPNSVQLQIEAFFKSSRWFSSANAGACSVLPLNHEDVQELCNAANCCQLTHEFLSFLAVLISAYQLTKREEAATVPQHGDVLNLHL